MSTREYDCITCAKWKNETCINGGTPCKDTVEWFIHFVPKTQLELPGILAEGRI